MTQRFSPAKVAILGVSLLVAFVFLIFLGRVVETVDADEILVVQDSVDGELHWYTTPGVKMQMFGSVTKYKKRSIYEFQAPVQFNDGGKGVIHGSVQYDLPLDEVNLRELHTRFGSGEAIQKQIMEVVTNKVIYMTGPVMSSRESYAEKRNYLISYAQDQIDLGVYRTRSVQKEEVDQFTQLKKTVTVAEIVQENGVPARQEKSVVSEFGIRAFNFSIKQIDYDDTVEKQIQDQQKITMEVQTSIADALKAQQQAITVQQQGMAQAAEAKWAQEVVKAKVVTEAQQQLEVQELATKRAASYKDEQILRGDADASYKRKLMEADGALAPKLQTLKEINQLWAEAFKNYQGQLVPSIVMGQGASGGQNGQVNMQQMMDLLTTKAAMDLGVTLKPGKQ